MHGDTHPFKLSFFIFSVLIAANLVLVTYILASSNMHGNSTSARTPSDLLSNPINMQTVSSKLAQIARLPGEGTVKSARATKAAISHSFAFVGGIAHGSASLVTSVADANVYAAAHTTNSIVGLAANATNVDTYIKGSGPAKVPVIAPLAAVKVVPTTPTPAATVAPVQQASFTHAADGTVLSEPQTILEYAWGNCTRWAATRRAQINDPIPSSWGNAATWAVRAARDGYVVDHHPTPGSIMQTPNSAGGLGHVAFVESVDPDGTWHISEMNAIGLDKVDYRALPPSAAAYYSFIHDKV